MIGSPKAAILAFSVAGICALAPAYGQTNAAPGGDPGDHSSSYYNFAMAHLYGEMAGAYGNRGEYVNKAIDYYQQAIKLDPTNAYIQEELTDFYLQTGQVEKAMNQAQALLKTNPNDANAHKALARIYSRQIGDPDQGKVDQTMLKNAIAEFQKASEIDPKDQETLSMLARLSRVAKDDVTAEKAYKQVLQMDPDDEDALNGLAMVYADRGDMAGATEMLKKAVEKNPDPRNIVMLAQFYEQAHDFEHATDAWKQAVDLTNGNTKVLQAYANDAYQAGRFDEALKALQSLADADPRNVKLQLQIAELLEKNKDFAGASAAIAKAKAIGNSPDVRYAEAELLSAEGKKTEAITAIQALLNDTKKSDYNEQERKDRIEMLEQLASFQMGAGKVQDGIASYRQISDLDPSLASKVEQQIVEELRNSVKDYKMARQVADAAVKKFPGDRSLTIMHAMLVADMGQPDLALTELRTLPNAQKDREILLTLIAPVQDKAKKFDDEGKTLDTADTLSKTPQEKTAVEFMRGAMFERQKNFDAAEKAFRSVIETEPNNANALNYLGYMFADRGVRLEEARQLISKALDIDPGNPAYLDSLAWVHYHLDQLDQASDELRKALDKIGDDPTVHDHLGDVYFKQGKLKEAIQQWETSVTEMKTAVPGDQDPIELTKITKKLEGAKVRVAQANR